MSFRVIENGAFVVDGGYLLHRVNWEKGAYAVIVRQYINFVTKHYAVNSTVVLDGYGNASIKDHEHQRRSAKSASNID